MRNIGPALAAAAATSGSYAIAEVHRGEDVGIEITTPTSLQHVGRIFRSGSRDTLVIDLLDRVRY